MKVLIRNETGLHARPAAMLVNEANKYLDEIAIVKDGVKYNAKSIMSIMSSAIVKGDEVEIESKNAEAIKAIAKFLDNLTE